MDKDWATYTKHLERKNKSQGDELDMVKDENIRLDRESRALRSELDRMRQPPLLSARIITQLTGNRVLVQTSAGPRFIITLPRGFDKKIAPNTRVGLNQRTFAVSGVLSDTEGLPYSAERAWSGLSYELEIVEVQDWTQISPTTNEKLVVKLKSLEDLKKVATTYRIPILFKKGDEYLGVYEDSPILWFKPEV